MRLAARQRVDLVELTLVRVAGVVLLKAPRGSAQNFEWDPRLVGVTCEPGPTGVTREMFQEELLKLNADLTEATKLRGEEKAENQEKD